MEAQINVAIDPKVRQKVQYWVDNSVGEVSGFGKVKFTDGEFRIIDAFLLEQENTASTTDIDSTALAKLMTETIQQDGYLNWWWHSHVNMGVFWSSQDRDTIEELGEQGMCLATVFNKKGQTRTAYHQAASKDGFVPKLFIDDIPLKTAYRVEEAEKDAWSKELKEKCKTKTFFPSYGGKYGSYNRFWGAGDDDYWDHGTGAKKKNAGGTKLKPKKLAGGKGRAASSFEDRDLTADELLVLDGLDELGLDVYEFVEGDGWYMFDIDQECYFGINSMHDSDYRSPLMIQMVEEMEALQYPENAAMGGNK